MKWSFDIMGDVHKWILDHPYVDAPNVTRVAVDNGVPSVRVTIRNDPVAPFTFDESPLMVQSDVCAQPGAELLDARQLAPLVDAAIWGLSQSGIPDAVKTLSGSSGRYVGRRPTELDSDRRGRSRIRLVH